MNGFKKLIITAGILISPMAQSGVPVIDSASIAQQVIQITHALSQIEELQSQLAQAERQLEAMSSSRGLGSLIDSKYHECSL